MAIERACEGARNRTIDMNGVVVRCRDDSAAREDETGDDRSTMSGELNVMWLLVVNPSRSSEVPRRRLRLVMPLAYACLLTEAIL